MPSLDDGAIVHHDNRGAAGRVHMLLLGLLRHNRPANPTKKNLTRRNAKEFDPKVKGHSE